MTLDSLEMNKELIVTKEMQEKLKLKEGDMLEIKKVNGKLVMIKKQTIEDLLDQPAIAKITLEEMKGELEDLGKLLDKRAERRL